MEVEVDLDLQVNGGSVAVLRQGGPDLTASPDPSAEELCLADEARVVAAIEEWAR